MILKPTRQKYFTKKVYGYDVETYNNNQSFYCATLWSDNYEKTVFSRREAIALFKTKRFRNSIIVCTNLGFDFDATFYRYEDHNFMPLYRNADRILEKTYLYNKKFNIKPYKKGGKPSTLTFIDTFNYAKLSVDKMGRILNVKKLKTPGFIGNKPNNKKEHDYLVKYNSRDAEISYKFLKLIFDTIEELGGTPKYTIASSAMSIFKNKYLEESFFTMPEYILEKIFKGYYGGRTEVFIRGRIKKYNYLDVNSLYPSMMLNSFPNPNKWRFNKINNIYYINNFDGMARVDIFCPDMEYPLLPFRYEDKVIFPTGSFTGTYTNIELRKAVELGYTIKKVYENIYFKENCMPFINYVQDLYKKRKELKTNDNPMEVVVKLLLNSLYGKFGEKFTDKDLYIPLPQTAEELNKYKDFEVIQEYVRIKLPRTMPKPHCIPIWASYVTAYGRIHMHSLLRKYHPVYTDTDSLITSALIAPSKELGKLDLEMQINEGVIVKPKFYAVRDNKWNIKIKGVRKGITMTDFNNILKGDKAKYIKFIKFKEAMRRKLRPNEIIEIEKELDTEDNKRIWVKLFNKNELQSSKPICLNQNRPLSIQQPKAKGSLLCQIHKY